MSTDEPPQISILDARLGEIDRRLGAIQTGLLDREGARPTAEPPSRGAGPTVLPPRVEIPSPATIAGAATAWTTTAGTTTAREAAIENVEELRGLAAAHGRLLESLQRLVGSYERTLTQSDQPQPAPAHPTQFSVSAGPFASTEALHGFERTLAQIPQVRDVRVRGYEGEDRAIVDVHLHDSTS